MGEKRNAYRILVGKLEGKRPLGRPRRRWVDSIKIYLRETGWDGVDWLRIGTGGGLLRIRWWSFRFHKMLGISWVAAQLADSQEGLSYVSKYLTTKCSVLILWSKDSVSVCPRIWNKFNILCTFHDLQQRNLHGFQSVILSSSIIS
jgi:hypothetical protein